MFSIHIRPPKFLIEQSAVGLIVKLINVYHHHLYDFCPVKEFLSYYDTVEHTNKETEISFVDGCHWLKIVLKVKS